MIASPKFGYYLVGEELFTNKVLALHRATETNIHPTWHYHNEIYNKLPWHQDLDVELKFLYGMRAKQLREKYDYVIVSFSGGSDSWTIVKAFHDYNVHIDEIFVRWPISATKDKFCLDRNNKHPSNILSEWDLAILPALEEFRDWFPNTRFTIVDWSDRFFSETVTDDDWLYCLPQDYLNPGAIPKFTSISDQERKMIESGKSTVLIDGIDKPQLWLVDGKIYCYFLDKLVNAHPPEIDGRNVEHFYWSPDFPEITHCQARQIYNKVKTQPEYLKMIDRRHPYNHVIKNKWNDFTRSIIYTDYVQRGFFQSLKSYTSVYDEVDAWMFGTKHKQELFMQSWKSTFDNIVKSIDQRYFDQKNGEILGYCGFFDQLYFLGTVDPQIYA